MTHQRALPKILKSIAEEMHLGFRTHHSERVIELTSVDQTHYVYDFDFDLNSASALLIAKDKSALSSLFTELQISHIEHVSFSRMNVGEEDDSGAVGGHGDDMKKYFLDHGSDVVCKPNFGSEGIGLFHVRTLRELESAVQRISFVSPSIALAPFVSIAHEYRCIVLDNECLLVYEKVRPQIIGDGESSVLELVSSRALKDGMTAPALASILQSLEVPLQSVPPPQETLVLEWKHNLVHGASVHILPESEEVQALRALALQAGGAIGLRFGAIDIVAEEGLPLRILEINAGVKMEAFVKTVPQGFERARAVYMRALEAMFPDA